MFSCEYTIICDVDVCKTIFVQLFHVIRLIRVILIICVKTTLMILGATVDLQVFR